MDETSPERSTARVAAIFCGPAATAITVGIARSVASSTPIRRSSKPGIRTPSTSSSSAQASAHTPARSNSWASSVVRA